MTDAADFTRRLIAVPDGEIAVLDFGDPDRPVDVIFSNGNGFNALSHRQALAPLGQDLRVLAADQRGHGHTLLPIHPEGRLDWWDLSRDLVALMDALDLERPVVLAGHSMGGVISLMAAEVLGPRVKSVACFDPVLGSRPQKVEDFPPHLKNLIALTLRRRTTFDSREAAFAAYKGRGVFATWPDETLVDYVADGFKDVPGGGVELACSPAWEASNYAAQGQDGRGILLATQVPTRVFRAEINSTCSVADGDPAAAANPNLHIETVAGTTHCLPMERPDVVQRGILAAALL